MKIFISHPYAADPQKNKMMADQIAKYWTRQDYHVISPLHLYSFHETDKHRKEIMEVCKHLIDICDIVAVYGDSKGCREERRYAEAKGKEVYILYEEMDYKYEMENNTGVCE